MMNGGGWLFGTEPAGEYEEDDLTRLMREGVKARREREWLAAEATMDKFLRERLEPKYAKQIFALDKIAPSTVKVYSSAFTSFASECQAAGVRALPSTVGAVATYLDHELASGVSPETIRRIVAAISYAHQARELRDPTEAPIVRAIVRAARTQNRKLNGKAKNYPAHA